jgi:hypothetical protein
MIIERSRLENQLQTLQTEYEKESQWRVERVKELNAVLDAIALQVKRERERERERNRAAQAQKRAENARAKRIQKEAKAVHRITVIRDGQECEIDIDECRRLFRRVKNKIDKLFKARLDRIWSVETETGDYPEFCALEIEKQLLTLYKEAVWYMKYIPEDGDGELYLKWVEKLEPHVRRGDVAAQEGKEERWVPPGTALILLGRYAQSTVPRSEWRRG